MNREQQKQKAMWAMSDMEIDKAYIHAFTKNNIITQFIRYAGYFIDENTEHNLLKKIKEIEEEYGCCVYAVTHENFEFGECFSMLYVSEYDEEQALTLQKEDDGIFYASAYVYNADNDCYSEFGTVGIKSAYGGIRRVY